MKKFVYTIVIGACIACVLVTQAFGLCFDVNSDSVADMKDVLLLRKYLAGILTVDSEISLMDVNADGSIDMKDVLLLRRYLAHLVDESGVEITTTTTTSLREAVEKRKIDFAPAYEALSAAERACYTQVVAEIEKNRYIESTTTIAGNEVPGLSIYFDRSFQSSQPMVNIYNAVMLDHPEYYYVDSSYGYAYVYSADMTKKNYNCLKIQYTISAKNRKVADAKVMSTVSSLLNATAGMKDVEKELYFHDYLCNHITYDNEAGPSGNSYTAYGALVEGKAVCTGYSKAFQYLCLLSGIRCTCVSGTATTAHTWNVIYLDDEAYYVDVTWDDGFEEGGPMYTYFNANRSILKSRMLSDENLVNPVCTATKYQYYRYYGLQTDSASVDFLADAVASAIKSGKKMASIQVVGNAYAVLQSTVTKEANTVIDRINSRLTSFENPLKGYSYMVDDVFQVLYIIPEK